MAHEVNTPECDNGWKLRVLSRWVLLGQPVGKEPEQNGANQMDEILGLCWSADWSTQWDLIKGECAQSIIKQVKPTEEVRKAAEVRLAVGKGMRKRKNIGRHKPSTTREVHVNSAQVHPTDVSPRILIQQFQLQGKRYQLCSSTWLLNN